MCFDGIELEINSRSMSHLPQAPGLPAWSQKSPWPLSPPKAALTRHWRNTWWPNLRTVVGTCWKKPRLLSCWGSTFNRKLFPSPNKMGITKNPRLESCSVISYRRIHPESCWNQQQLISPINKNYWRPWIKFSIPPYWGYGYLLSNKRFI